MVSSTVPQRDEDEADDQDYYSCRRSDGRSCRRPSRELAGGQFMENGRHCRAEMKEIVLCSGRRERVLRMRIKLDGKADAQMRLSNSGKPL